MHDQTFAARCDRVLARIDKARKNPGQLPGLSTGIKALDEAIDGLQPTHLLCLAGRPAMGKTALATTIAFHVARDAPVGFLSLEQPGDELALRVVADVADMPMKDLKRGIVTPDQRNVIAELISQIKTRQLHIADSFDRHLDKIREEAARLYDTYGIRALFIDYLQLATAKDVRTRDREIAQISAGLKQLALDFDIPVIAVSQLNREVEKTNDKRPAMAHLRESGAIEQDADIVALLFREHYYFMQKPKPDLMDNAAYQNWQQNLSRCYGKAELIIAKNRHGPPCTIELAFNEKRMRFSDLEKNLTGAESQ
ncbi:replicative DNA helicase [bacterium MnTg02]|nr:replicative DNA helicase [bacterium MnTg02]